jgi:hypothetical protein
VSFRPLGMSEHPLTRDFELARRLELLTCCLQDSCATDCATPAMPGQPTQVSRSEDSGTTDECRATASHDDLLARTQECGPAAYKIKFCSGRASRNLTVGYQQDPPAG